MHADIAGKAFQLLGEAQELVDFLLGRFALVDERLDLARELREQRPDLDRRPRHDLAPVLEALRSVGRVSQETLAGPDPRF
jgi:hypothetical protein